jgi:hypothetical protein
MLLMENRSTGKKICRSAALSATNTSQTYLWLIPSLCTERPATNHLSHVTTIFHETLYEGQSDNTKSCAQYTKCGLTIFLGLFACL